MEKNNNKKNSSDSLVFGRWPQTTRPYLQDVELWSALAVVEEGKEVDEGGPPDCVDAAV